MKVCLYNVTTAVKIGGIETFYWEIAKKLKEKNIDVEIISGNGNHIKYKNIPIKMFKYKDRNKIFDLGNRFRKWGERISFFRNSYKYLLSQQYEIFIIHKPLDFFVSYFIKKVYPDTKFIFISGGEDFYGFDKYFAKYIDYMFAVSSANQKIIQQRYKKDVEILHNGVDIDVFKMNLISREKLRNKYNLKNKKVLISVGRIVGWKGYQLVIQALQKLENFHYICIGDGENLTNLKKLAYTLKVEDKVLFLGQIDNLELPKYLSMGDIFVQPSIGHEAFGITLIEAMACSLKVVASRNGGMVDVVKDGISGYLFETNNIDDLIDKIKLADQSDLNPRKWVEENFTWEKTVKKLLKVIK